MNDLTVIVLAAGKGTRMKSSLTKVCHKVGDKPMIKHVTETAAQLNPKNIIVVVSNENLHDIKSVVNSNIKLQIQREQLGTGHAVLNVIGNISPTDLLVLLGDVPLITPQTLSQVISKQFDAVIIGFRDHNPENKFGRIILQNDEVHKIVEYLDASPEERKISLCNSGMLFIRKDYISLLYEITNNNKKGEYYLTDIVQIMTNKGLRVGYLEADVDECMGVNSPEELAKVNFLFNKMIKNL